MPSIPQLRARVDDAAGGDEPLTAGRHGLWSRYNDPMGIRKIKTAVLLILIQGAAGPALAQNPGLGQAPDPFGEGLESDDTLPRFRVEVLAFAHSAFDPNEEIFPDEHDLILLDTRPPEILVSLPTDPEYPATPKGHLEMGPPEQYRLRPTFAEQLLASLLPLEDPPDEPDTELLGPYPLDPDFVGPPEPFNPALSAGPLRPFGPDVAAPADPFGANPFGADPFGSPLTEVFPDRDPERPGAPTGPIAEDGAIGASAATANETDEQLESAESIEASMQLAEETEEVEPPPAFRFLRADELQLQDTFRSLTRAGDYTPLAHGGWVQIAYPPERAQPIDLSRLGVVNPVGTVQLHLSRFLHVTVDLVYRAPPSVRQAAGSDSLEELKLPARYALRTQRLVRSGEVHYFDHPAIGVLVVITPQPVEAEDADDPLRPPVGPAA